MKTSFVASLLFVLGAVVGCGRDEATPLPSSAPVPAAVTLQ